MKGGHREGAGRPAGAKNKLTSALKRTLAEVAGEYTDEALKTLATVMKDPKAPHAARVSAANAILDRSHGKPKQPVEHELDLSNLTDEQISLLALALGAPAVAGPGDGGDRETPRPH